MGERSCGVVLGEDECSGTRSVRQKSFTSCARKPVANRSENSNRLVSSCCWPRYRAGMEGGDGISLGKKHVISGRLFPEGERRDCAPSWL